MKKSPQKKGIIAIGTAFIVGIMKDPIKRKIAINIVKKVFTFMSRSSKKTLKK